jgi:cytochrome c-type biogenesis protein CcmH
MTRAVSWGLLAVVVVVALAVGTVSAGEARTVEEQVHDIATTIRCPQCRSQSVADSDAATAQAARVEITERVEEGQSAAEIRDYFASAYGDQILLNPPSSGVGSLVWIIPVVAVVGGGVGLFFAFRRWKAWD